MDNPAHSSSTEIKALTRMNTMSHPIFQPNYIPQVLVFCKMFHGEHVRKRRRSDQLADVEEIPVTSPDFLEWVNWTRHGMLFLSVRGCKMFV